MPGILWKLHADNKYAHLLALLVLFFVLTPLFKQTRHTSPIISFAFICILILTMRAIALHRRTRRICAALLLLGFALDMTSYLAGRPLLHSCLAYSAMTLYLLIMLLTIVTMIHRLFTTMQVTWDTILGGISTYLLLGFFWSLLYLMLHQSQRATFQMALAYHPVYLVYFSFTTLATVGYGDIVPTNGLAMMLANFEALVGQLFLTVFIARLIGLHLAHHGR